MMKKLDMLTPLGVVLGIVFVGVAILTNAGPDSFASFINIPSILVVIGGLIGAMLVSFSFSELKQLGKVMAESFRVQEHDTQDLISTFVSLSDKARREGLLSLETEVEEIKDPFIRKGVLLAVDGIESDVITDILNTEIIALEERHRKNKRLLDKAGEYAPAWGMIGTLIGLVLMLQNLSDPSSLGPNMAVALLTTLYGTLLANLVFIPMASKLAMKTEKEVFRKQIVIEAVMGLQSGQNPRVLEEKLTVFLSGEELTTYRLKDRDSVDEG